MLTLSPHPQLRRFDNGQQNLAEGQTSGDKKSLKGLWEFVGACGHVDDTDCLHSLSRLPRGVTHPAAESDASSYPNMIYPG